jgi:hypothetical protein
MTCAHVLGLIDAGPFADYPPAHLAAALQHARQCGTCGHALETATRLTAALTELDSPAPPPHLAVNVMARIARIEAANPLPAAAAGSVAIVAPSTRDWSAWATAFGGLAAGLAIVVSTQFGEASAHFLWPRLRWITTATVAMPASSTGALFLGIALLLYVGGLFAPLRDRRRLEERANRST